MNLKCVLLLFILTAIPMFCGSSQAARSSTLPVIVPDDVQSEPLEDEEIPRTQKNTYPYVEVHGDYRWLWGKGRFSAYSEQLGKGRRRHDEAVYLATRRQRIFPFIHLNEHTSIRTQLEDNRNDKDHNQDHHLYLGRLYIQHETERMKLEAGRFNYYLLDGNVIDKKVDGLRFRLGQKGTSPGSITLFAGQTTGADDEHRKIGWSLFHSKRNGRFQSDTVFLDFRNASHLPPAFPSLAAYGIYPERAGRGFDRQRILQWRGLYQFQPDFRASLELLHAWGRHEADQYSQSETGFVASLIYGELDERKQGSYEAWIRYYNQPSSTILYHTMDADTTFFRRMGFRGWGIRLDYILRPGLVWAVEGFSLKNRQDASLAGSFHEYVLGTSLTAYF